MSDDRSYCGDCLEELWECSKCGESFCYYCYGGCSCEYYEEGDGLR